MVVLLTLAKCDKLLLPVNRDSSTEQLVKGYRRRPPSPPHPQTFQHGPRGREGDVDRGKEGGQGVRQQGEGRQPRQVRVQDVPQGGQRDTRLREPGEAGGVDKEVKEKEPKIWMEKTGK